jgi:hypothetical protein
MTARTARSLRTGAAGLLLIAASLLVAAGLTLVATVGVAAPAPVDGAVDPSMAAVIPPPPAPAAGVVQDAPAGGLAGSAAAAAAAAAPRPSDALTNPATSPVAAWDDVLAARRVGWPAAVFACVTLLALALGTAGARFAWLSWLARGTAATLLGALAACGTAGYDAAIAGGSPAAVGSAAVLAVFAFWQARRTPVPRQPEHGSAASPLLVILAGAALTVAAMGAWSCVGVQRAARSTASSLVDCTTSSARAHAAEYGSLLEAAIRAATSPEGQVDRVALKGAVQGLALETGWCAAELTVARILSSFPVLRVAPGGYDPAAGLREAWEAVRSERWEGKRFRVGEGPEL